MNKYISKNFLDIERLIKSQQLTEEAIIDIMKCNSNDISLLMKKPLGIVKKALVRIYWNPEELYDIEMSENLLENLVDFVKYRYQNETAELEYFLSKGFINKEEQLDLMTKIDEKFFPMTAVGNNIRRLVEKEPEPKIKRKSISI